MKKILTSVIIIFMFSSGIHAAAMVDIVPVDIHITPEGLVVRGDTNVHSLCERKNSIYLLRTDINYKEKLSVALAAQASGKYIRAYVLDETCRSVSAYGTVPTVHDAYWRIINK